MRWVATCAASSLECGLLSYAVTVLRHASVFPPLGNRHGIFAGATNVIPYVGTAVALLGGWPMPSLAEEVRPFSLPMVNPGNFVIWVIAAVILSQVLKTLPNRSSSAGR